MKTPKCRTFVGDFETTVYKGQTHTEVWASALVEIGSEDVKIFHSIGETYDYFLSLKTNLVVYYHNLKFDGAFWISYLLGVIGMKQAFTANSDREFDLRKDKTKEMPNNSFNYNISDMGQWYSITIKVHKHIIELRDSLKLLPFSVKRIGESFGTTHKKLDMEYHGLRYAGCEITEQEQRYIANDVLVVKEALEIMFAEGHNSLTIGACCLHEYKNIIGKKTYDRWFPDIYAIPLDIQQFGSANAGEYIRKSYKGGWCYLVKGKENQVKYNGTTADVNSLYPSMMHSESGNYYPVGLPHFWHGNYIPFDEINDKANPFPEKRFFFVRIRTRFFIKDGMLPFIQAKHNAMYRGTEMLECSDIYDANTDTYVDRYIDMDGNEKIATIELTLTQTDYFLFLKHYDVLNFEVLDGCWFRAIIGLFDDYIDKYRAIKVSSKGAKRELAKLFLNNLYGKMATNTNSSFKYAVLDNNVVHYISIVEHDKQAGYIPVGSAITSYARCFTINAAQANYHGKNERGFIYADTDSIHCDLSPDEITGIRVHPKDFCCWKLESCWDYGLFVRQKTYIEHITQEDCEDVEPFYNIRCAGMPERCKNLFLESVAGNTHEGETDRYSEEELDFLRKKRKITDFKIGLKIAGKLVPKRIQGGVLLVETTYEMR